MRASVLAASAPLLPPRFPLTVMALSRAQVFRVMDFLYYLSFIKLFVSFIKYMPQVYLNWARKSRWCWCSSIHSVWWEPQLT